MFVSFIIEGLLPRSVATLCGLSEQRMISEWMVFEACIDFYGLVIIYGTSDDRETGQLFNLISRISLLILINNVYKHIKLPPVLAKL